MTTPTFSHVSHPGFSRQVWHNFAATFNNNKAESVRGIVWTLWLVATQVLHAAEPGVALLLGALAAPPLLMFWAEMNTKARGINMTVELVVAAAFLWSALAVAIGLNLYIFTGWLLLLAAGYFSFFRAIFAVQYEVTSGKVQEVKPEAVEDFPDTEWLKGCRWDGAERMTPTGTVRRLRLRSGMGASDFTKKQRDGMASVLGLDPAAVQLKDPKLGNVVDVYRHDRVDVHAEPKAWPWADRTVMDVRQPIPLGLRRDGSVATINLSEGHMLVGGATRSGKSVAVAMPTIAAALDPQVDLFIIDPKLADMAMFKRACRMYANDDYGDILRVLEAVAEEIPRRGELCSQHGVRKVQEIKPNPDGTRAVPTIVLVIDELAHLTVDAPDDWKKKAEKLLGKIVKQGAAADVITILATQRPSADAIPTDIRAQIRDAFALRTREKNTARMIAGDIPGVDTTEIPVDRKGVGILVNEDGVHWVRSFYVPDDEVYRLAALAPEALPVGPALSEVAELATVHELPSAAQGGVARFPDGQPVPGGWRSELWSALSHEYRGAAELLDLLESKPDRKTLKKTLDDWTAARYLAATRDGNTTKWRRAA